MEWNSMGNVRGLQCPASNQHVIIVNATNFPNLVHWNSNCVFATVTDMRIMISCSRCKRFSSRSRAPMNRCSYSPGKIISSSIERDKDNLKRTQSDWGKHSLRFLGTNFSRLEIRFWPPRIRITLQIFQYKPVHRWINSSPKMSHGFVLSLFVETSILIQDKAHEKSTQKIAFTSTRHKTATRNTLRESINTTV